MGTWARNSTWKYIRIGKEADDILVEPPSGKKTIDSTAEVDVSAYATAQVVDANLTAENIKKDVEVLGITGEYEGGGSSDFSTAEVTVVIPVEMENLLCPIAVEANALGEGSPACVFYQVNGMGTHVVNVPLYKGLCYAEYNNSTCNCAVTGNIQEQNGVIEISGNGTITLTIK